MVSLPTCPVGSGVLLVTDLSAVTQVTGFTRTEELCERRKPESGGGEGPRRRVVYPMRKRETTEA